MEPVFVYGTLKQNQPNNYHLNDTKNGCAVFRSVAVTVNKYPLVISTRFNIPFLLQNEGTGNEIKGEIYDVDTKMLEYLDDFENHPNFYERQKTQVKLPNADIMNCWIYFLPNYPDSYLELQRFDNYDSCGEHGLPYVTSEELHLLE
ncbi:unnamed protein product [Macrosiphum euphorbiae]|uniref:Gamma-glutamylcyclotransferase family protein n=1 Tax=Macrosiphum euphorbiae TaxID=13131 RepID=A0AAV0X0Z8_9HEMI|nr:unnamed protein product [Macrosiphum euphorbiae]